MTYKHIRHLAYDYGRRVEYTFPCRWIDNKTAGLDCLQRFMKRHKNLTFRKPENTLLFRTNAFNKTNVIELLDNYELTLKPWEFIKVFIIFTNGCTA
jgi:hypothetical protein